MSIAVRVIGLCCLRRHAAWKWLGTSWGIKRNNTLEFNSLSHPWSHSHTIVTLQFASKVGQKCWRSGRGWCWTHSPPTQKSRDATTRTNGNSKKNYTGQLVCVWHAVPMWARHVSNANSLKLTVVNKLWKSLKHSGHETCNEVLIFVFFAYLCLEAILKMSPPNIIHSLCMRNGPRDCIGSHF